jgi:hypothetical protein
MLSTVQTFFDSPNAIVATCIGSWAVSSTSMEDIIHRPISSVFWPLLFGGIAGSWITSFTPKGFTPHVAGVITGITVLGLLARGFGYGSKNSNKTFVDIVAESLEKEQNKCKISYTAHSRIENQGIVINTEKPLCSTLVKELLIGSLEHIDSAVIPNIDMIENIVRTTPNIDKMASIFIHDGFQGYVMIDGPNKISRHTLSIKINS